MPKKSIILSLAAMAMLLLAACMSSDRDSSGNSESRDGMGQRVDPKTGTPVPGSMQMGY